MEFLLDDSTGSVTWKNHNSVQEAFECKGYISGTATDGCIEQMISVTNVVQKTASGKKLCLEP